MMGGRGGRCCKIVRGGGWMMGLLGVEENTV